MGIDSIVKPSSTTAHIQTVTHAQEISEANSPQLLTVDATVEIVESAVRPHSSQSRLTYGPVANNPAANNTQRIDSNWDFYPRFLRLGGVNILSNLMVPLAGLVDIAFLGHLEDLNYLAGVAIATVLFEYLYRMSKFLRMGTTGPTAQAVGRDDSSSILLTLLRNSLIALVLGGIILVVQIPFRELGFALLNATPEVKAAGVEYFNARIWGAPAVLLNFVLLGWWVGREKGGKVLALSLVGNGTNILLDYILVFQMGWASAGVGLATTISQYLMVLLGLIFIATEGWVPQISTVYQQIWHPQDLRQTVKINTDIWIRSCANVSVSALFIGLSSSFGTLTLAANTLLLHAVSLISHVVCGLAFATESLAGHFQGAGTRSKLLPLLQLSVVISIGIGFSAACFFTLFPTPLFSLLTNHGAVITQVSHYSLWLFPVIILGAIAFMLNGYFLGLTQSVLVRNSIVISALMGFLPLAGVAWWQHHDQLLWFAMVIFMGIRVITQIQHIPNTLQTEHPATASELHHSPIQQPIGPLHTIDIHRNKKVA